MIGFFGGSFDPVHYGHLKNARVIKQELNLEQLFLLPCNTPVHKNSLFFSNQQRLDMLNLAVTEFPDLLIDLQEINQQMPAYTIDSLKKIKKTHPNQQIFLIIGADSFATLNTWKDYQAFSDYAQLVVLPRTNYVIDSSSYNKVYFAKTPLIDISSTQIRAKIRTHQDLSGLMPDSIINYLRSLS